MTAKDDSPRRDIFVAAAGTIHDDDLVARHFRRDFAMSSDGMRGFERGNDAFRLGERFETLRVLRRRSRNRILTRPISRK